MSMARSISKTILVLRPILFIIPLFFFSPSNLGETNASDGMMPAINSAESRSLLEITAIHAEPAPGIGVPFRLTIEVISTSDQENALIAIDAEAPVQVLSESRRVETSLRANVPVRLPPLSLCTDNAAMIAAVGHVRHQAGQRDALDIDALPNWPLAG
jgi:hypothetical protein